MTETKESQSFSLSLSLFLEKEEQEEGELFVCILSSIRFFFCYSSSGIPWLLGSEWQATAR